jgi:hypothetical protein
MSWSGTVTCSHCYKRGHNKRKCPKLTESILRDYKDHMAAAADALERNGEVAAVGYTQNAERYRVRYMKRTKIDPATGEKVKNKTAKAERMKSVTCGYCKATGHTRRICEAVKADYQVYLVETRQVREDAARRVRETGIGAGSMVTFKAHGYNSAGEWGTHMSLNYIKGYRWETCDAHSQSLPVEYVSHKNIPRMSDPYHMQSISFEALVKKMEEQDTMSTASLAGSVEPPKGWADGGKTLKEAFPTQGSKYDKEREYSYSWPSTERKEIIQSLGLEQYYRPE